MKLIKEHTLTEDTTNIEIVPPEGYREYMIEMYIKPNGTGGTTLFPFVVGVNGKENWIANWNVGTGTRAYDIATLTLKRLTNENVPLLMEAFYVSGKDTLDPDVARRNLQTRLISNLIYRTPESGVEIKRWSKVKVDQKCLAGSYYKVYAK